MLLTNETLPQINEAISLALESSKDYQVEIKLFDNSLRARQRSLANIWYQQIDNDMGTPTGHAEAYCKYKWGLKLSCLNDSTLEGIIRKMLYGHDYETKLKIIQMYPEWFPVLRAKGGLDAEGQAKYLTLMQVHFADQGIILTSPKEKELLNCKEANKL